jgi:phospholipid/cholesterol/gamma-HCH transport system ATP-binding protein
LASVPENNIIEIKNLSKAFGTHQVLRNISCTLKRGATTVFIGPSGTGKSVLIKHLVGLLKPDAGNILIDGEDITHMGMDKLVKVRMKFGLCFQDGALFDSMSVGENIAFPLRRHTTKSNDEIESIVSSKLRLVGLPGIEWKMPAQLSGGMRKRVGIARAIALEPEIVFFDEPNSGLDPVMSAAIDDLILQMKSELGSTFVVISHDIEGTWKVADYIGMLYKSELIEYGSKEEIRACPNPILRQFFGRSTIGPIAIA